MLWLSVGLALAMVSVALGCWLAGAPWAHYAPGRGQPERTPLWWPWIVALEPACARLVTWAMRRRLHVWAARAGLSPRWTAERWLVLRCLMGFLGFIGGVLCAVGLHMSPRFYGVVLAAGALLGFAWPQHVLRRRAAVRRARMQRELPFMLDLMTLCVEAGLSLAAALRQVAAHAPSGPLRQSLQAAAALERTGMARARWLSEWARRADLPALHTLVLTLAQADSLGMNLGPLLRAQAERQRSDRFLRAESLALQAPVKMLFPVVLCIFPGTFLVIAFPVAVKLLDGGLT